MKKILFVLPSLATGGLERVQVTVANALARKGHDVTVMTLDADHTMGNLLDKNVKLIHKPYKKTFMHSVPYIRHKFYDSGMLETRMSPEKLHKYYVGDEKYDVEIGFFRGLAVKIVSGAHTDFEMKSLCTKSCAEQHNDFEKKSVCTKTLAWVHNDFEQATGYQNNFKNMKDVFKAYKSYDKVVCVSKQAEQSFKKVIGDTGNTQTIYNMLPISEIKTKAREEVELSKHSFNVVLVGRLLDSAKGQIRLVSVAKKLQDEGIDIGVTLIGDGADKQLIQNKINRLGAGNFVYMLGNQANPYSYVSRADLLVCASYFEGYNLTVAEALICGTPVLSTNCTGPTEILDGGKYGMIVDNSEQGLYEGLKALATDKEKYSHYKQMASKRIDFFDEEKITAQIEALWK